MSKENPSTHQMIPNNECRDIRTSSDPKILIRAILENLHYVKGRTPKHATMNDWYTAVARTVGDRLLDRWVKTLTTQRRQPKIVSYLSAEFLPGPHLGNAMINLGIYEQVEEAIRQLGLDPDTLLDHEQEPGLGNGGLGRLAACFLDSLATLRFPAIGYGIRYEFGIFDQEIRDGWQKEITDKWLAFGNPWEIPRPEITYRVNFGGYTEYYDDEDGFRRVRWIPRRVDKGVAYDTPIPGYDVPVVDLLRLWKSEAAESFDFEAFNEGDYYGAVEEKIVSETITKVLYPNDEPVAGKRLRLVQQYFFVSCSLQDMIRLHELQGNPLTTFHEGFAIQLNDTHPSIAVVELMRILVDERRMDWDLAWSITRQAFAYTNHTILPEALEKWPLPLFRRVLPRHLEIIFEINRRFLDEIRFSYPGDEERVRRLSVIDESDEKYIRMAHLAAIGSHSINGVSVLHTAILKQTVMRDFYEISPVKFHNITNGVTPRRWIVLSNPGLTSLITEAIGDRWISCFEEEIIKLEPFAYDANFRKQWYEVKKTNKGHLAAVIKDRTGIAISSESVFDVQAKRIHEYKRQHLNILHVITLYRRLKTDPSFAGSPRTVIFGGKAAPGYFMAKLIIKLINSVAEVVNRDSGVADRLKVVFFPDFNVQNGQRIYPAADLSEQISTAGTEASGTGNMKFSINGALTIGTLDGANAEIRRQVGEENFFLFGLDTNAVHDLKESGYNPRVYYEGNEQLKDAIDLISSGFFSRGDPDLFQPLVDSLLNRDEYLVLADYHSYVQCQKEVGSVYEDRDTWTTKSILNVARMGRFSSDRSIREYVEKIWKVKPLSPAE
ncbi:MAG TPA: glycogen/starch/alpha-glucan phosphorylase [Syntrophorhabdaceae bacterium]|nr:glycogen/starch/alpha-glucan phosphorylase [Syntrophorhabdaceae bacterium]